MQTEKRKIIQNLNKLVEKQKQCEKVYGIRKWNTLADLEQLILRADALKKQVSPTELWFQPEQHEYIKEMLDETQTKTEDSIKAKKRILKVWNKEIFRPYNVRFVNEYVEAAASSFKYLSVRFWKHKKALRALFLETEDLFTDEEIKVLKKNLAVLEESENWLFFKNKKIVQALGESYLEKETDFISLRKMYDLFYTFWEEAYMDEKKFTRENYEEFLAHMGEIRLTELYQEVKGLLSGLTEEKFLHSDVKDLLKQCKSAAKSLPEGKDAYRKYGFILWDGKIEEESFWNRKKVFAVPKNAGERRAIETVSDGELLYAVLRIIEVEEEIGLDDLEKLIANLLGYARRTKKLNDRIGAVVKQLKEEGRILRFSEGWRKI